MSATQAGAKASADAARLQLQRLQLLYATNLPVVLAGILLAGFFGWLLWPYASPALIGAWLAAVTLTQLGRLYLLYAFRRAQRRGRLADPWTWARRQTGLHLAIGLAWGVGAGVILPAAPLIHQAVVILFFGGAATAGIFVAMHLPAYLAYILGVLVPLSLGVWVGAPGEARYLALMLVLYMVVAVIIGRQVARMADDIFQLRIDNEQLVSELRHQASTDALTGAANWREFMRRARSETRAAAQAGHPLAVIGLDLDHFKAVNDRHGHAVGDALLAAIARACHSRLAPGELLGRLGGEEFAVLLPQCGGREAAERAEGLRRVVEATRVAAPDGPVGVTASAGVAVAGEVDYEVQPLLNLADKRLYAAKASGRDRVVSGGHAAGGSR